MPTGSSRTTTWTITGGRGPQRRLRGRVRRRRDVRRRRRVPRVHSVVGRRPRTDDPGRPGRAQGACRAGRRLGGYSPRKLGARPARRAGGHFSTSHSAAFRPSHRRPNRSASRTTVFTSTRSGFSRCPRPPRRRRGRHVMSGLRAITYPTRNRRNGRSGSSRTVGIPVTTPTMHRATAGTRCRAATDSARAGSREQTQNARHAGVLAHFASFTLTS